MTDDEFWHVIGLVDWQTAEDDAIVEPVVEYLAASII